MEAVFVIILILTLANVITDATKLQIDSDDGRAWITIICNLFILVLTSGMFVYYLLNVYHILNAGR